MNEAKQESSMKKLKVLPKDRLIKTSRTLYFLKDGEVYRGNFKEKSEHRGRALVKNIVKINVFGCRTARDEKIAEVLKRHGVKIIA